MNREQLNKILEPNYLALEEQETILLEIERDLLINKVDKKVSEYKNELIGLSQLGINEWLLNKIAKLELK
mgnify:FL=1